MDSPAAVSVRDRSPIITDCRGRGGTWAVSSHLGRKQPLGAGGSRARLDGEECAESSCCTSRGPKSVASQAHVHGFAHRLRKH